MIIYAAHKYGGDKGNIARCGEILRRMQCADLDNCYVSPLHCWSYLNYEDIPYDDFMEICFDLLSSADKMIVLSDVSEGVKREIEMARRMGMEVEFIGDVRQT